MLYEMFISLPTFYLAGILLFWALVRSEYGSLYEGILYGSDEVGRGQVGTAVLYLLIMLMVMPLMIAHVLKIPFETLLLYEEDLVITSEIRGRKLPFTRPWKADIKYATYKAGRIRQHRATVINLDGWSLVTPGCRYKDLLRPHFAPDSEP